MQINNLKKSFEMRGGSPSGDEGSSVRFLEVLNSVSFGLESGKIYGLIGPSAGGKSVLLKILAGVMEPDAGEIRYGNVNQQDVGLMFQEGALFDSLNAFENVAFPLIAGDLPVAARGKMELQDLTNKVAWILSRVGLAKAHKKVPGQLSGGMRKRLALARALVSRPDLVLLDDPTSGLDPVASAVIMRLIVEIQQDYKPTMVVVSHDLRRLLPVVDSVIALFDGEIAYHGPSENLKLSPEKVQHFVACRYDLN
jgi:phospholipid/cholesterol/gamma-HCH transport system ATP-binding protein